MTIVFLQTIGLFHRSPAQRASSSLYHGMVVLVSAFALDPSVTIFLNGGFVY